MLLRAPLPILGVLLTVILTTAMDAAGLSAFSALPLFPCLVVLCRIERLSMRSIGLVWGRGSHHALAAIYPALVLGTLALISAVGAGFDVSRTDWRKAGFNLVLVTLSTVLLAILTEEGFFRGWLWASLARRREAPSRLILSTSLAFSLWHVSAVTLDTDFELPAAQIPVFLLNAAVLGAVWGFLRWLSGSVIVASVSHGLWNGFAYVFFGFGGRAGALGIEDTALFGPESGLLGLGLNVVSLGLLLWWWTARARDTA